MILHAAALGLVLALGAPAQEPPAKPRPAFEVHANHYVTADGKEVQTGQRTALAEALLRANPGDVIELHVQVSTISIAQGNPSHRHVAVRDRPFEGITIRGATPEAGISNINLGDTGGGIASLAFEDLVIDARKGQVGLIAYMNTQGGTIRLTRVRLWSSAKTKWGVRGHGSYGWVFEDCTFLGGGQEHAVYVDNVQGLVMRDCFAQGWRRTMLQVVLRTYPHTRPSSGDVWIENNKAENCGEDGAGSFTVAGHLGGTVYFVRNQVQSKFGTSAFVAYLDQKQYGLKNPHAPAQERRISGPGYVIGAEFDEEGRMLTPGFALEHLVIVDPSAYLPSTDRAVLACGAVRKLEIVISSEGFTSISSNKQALDIAHGGQPCDEVYLLSRRPPWSWNWRTPMRFSSDRTEFDPMELWQETEAADAWTAPGG